MGEPLPLFLHFRYLLETFDKKSLQQNSNSGPLTEVEHVDY